MQYSTTIARTRVGIYIDAANVMLNGGSHMQYSVLRDFACRDGAEPVFMTAYVVYDRERARYDATYRSKADAFHAMLRDQGYKIEIKEVQTREDDLGKFSRANADVSMAIDAITQANRLDRVLLVTGDGDFLKVVETLQKDGCRVEVIGVRNVAMSLQHKANLYVSAYAIPNLIPVEYESNGNHAGWGEIGSRVRGRCYHYDQTGGFGYLRYWKCIPPNLWIHDSNPADAPYQQVFFHISNLHHSLRPGFQPSMSRFYEFTLAEEPGRRDPKALDIKLISSAPSE